MQYLNPTDISHRAHSIDIECTLPYTCLYIDRYVVYQKIKTLFPVIKDGLYISRFGVPNYRLASHWLPIYR